MGRLEQAGRHNGQAVFVDGALPGETVRLRQLTFGRSYATARVVAWLHMSPDRVQPACPLFGRCGGCSLQHLTYDGQLKWKAAQVRNALIHLGQQKPDTLDLLMLPILPAPSPWRYRAKVQIPVQGQAGKLQLGFYARDSHQVTDGSCCLIQHPVADQLRAALRGYLDLLKISPYDERQGQGLLRHLLIRHAEATGQVMLVPVVTDVRRWQDRVPVSQLVELAQAACEQAGLTFSSYYINENRQPGNRILGNTYTLLWGQAQITERINALAYQISPAAFFQVNPRQTERLYQTVLDFLQTATTATTEPGAADAPDTAAGYRSESQQLPYRRIWDLYCGSGSISLALTAVAREVIGVEIVPAAIRDARSNAQLNKLTGQCRFFEGAAEALAPELLAEGLKPDAVVVDPPRKGLDEKLTRLLHDLAVPVLVYVSCNPATLARDIARLQPVYQLRAVRPVDMFPQTTHVETVVLMSRRRD